MGCLRPSSLEEVHGTNPPSFTKESRWASAAFSNRLYRLDRSRLWSDEGLQTFLGSLRGIFTQMGCSRHPSIVQLLMSREKRCRFCLRLSVRPQQYADSDFSLHPLLNAMLGRFA